MLVNSDHGWLSFQSHLVRLLVSVGREGEPFPRGLASRQPDPGTRHCRQWSDHDRLKQKKEEKEPFKLFRTCFMGLSHLKPLKVSWKRLEEGLSQLQEALPTRILR